MYQPNFMILYVDSPAASAVFYRNLFDLEPVESSATFVLFALERGLMIGLWSRHTVEPAATAAGGAELAFSVDGDEYIDSIYREWQERGVGILLPPTDMDFGRSFVALDPDGHRLRVFALKE